MIEQLLNFIENPTWLESLAIIGTLCLAFCGLPEAIYSFRNKTCRVPSALLWTWFVGEILLAVYVIVKGDFILTINYLSNIILVGICVYYWIKERI